MVQLTSFITLGLVAASASAAPILNKRIAQVIADSTAKWEQACLAAGGGQKCNPVSITAFTTLLAAAGPCEQQDAADSMINLAKELNDNASMINLTQIFVQQPRNSPNSVAIPYCQKAPQNAELNGLFQCQFVGSNQQKFANGAALGGDGTIPFVLNAPLNPLGSCPAHPDGPVPDGQQLTDLISTPGVPSGRNGGKDGGAPPTATTAVPATTAAPSGGDFKLANGQAAQKLNAKFSTLTADSACTAGENACVGTAFAQCVDGKFVTHSCGASPLTCAALPLVNSPGTSITCTTLADAEARIAATGATGGVTSSDSTGAGRTGSDSGSKPADNEAVTKSSGLATNSGSAFRLQNGKDAKALNVKFATLNANSSCTDGEEACVGAAFAQCVGGKFIATPCGATLTCAALPLVNSRGTSITCAAPADVTSRIAATGA